MPLLGSLYVSFIFLFISCLFPFQLCQDVLVQLGKALETYDDVDNEVPDRSPSPHTSANGHHATLQNGQDSPESTQENITTKIILTPEVMVIVCTVLSLCTKRLGRQGKIETVF